LGNQPSRKNIPGKGGNYRHSRKMVDSAKKNVSSKKYSRATKIALGAALKDSGKSFLAAVILASVVAYKASKQPHVTRDTQRITNNAINYVIKRGDLDVTKQGRTILKSGITEALSFRR